MAGSLSVTVQERPDAGMVRYLIAWQCDASGNVSGHQTELSVLSVGLLVQAKIRPFVPPTPTNLYDVTLVDGNGIDYLSGLGANQSNTSSRYIVPTTRMFRDDAVGIDLVVANAGVSTTGLVYLWYRAARVF